MLSEIIRDLSRKKREAEIHINQLLLVNFSILYIISFVKGTCRTAPDLHTFLPHRVVGKPRSESPRVVELAHTRRVVGHSRLNQRVSDWFHTLPLIDESDGRAVCAYPPDTRYIDSGMGTNFKLLLGK